MSEKGNVFSADERAALISIAALLDAENIVVLHNIEAARKILNELIAGGIKLTAELSFKIDNECFAYIDNRTRDVPPGDHRQALVLSYLLRLLKGA